MKEIASHLLEFTGATLEIIGALYLANRYLNRLRLAQIPWSLLSVVWEGEAAKDLAFLSEISEERALSSLKGILLLILGFSVRSVPHICYLVGFVWDLLLHKA
jgi:hypothetical protein